jgi:hypothetical protein
MSTRLFIVALAGASLALASCGRTSQIPKTKPSLRAAVSREDFGATLTINNLSGADYHNCMITLNDRYRLREDDLQQGATSLHSADFSDEHGRFSADSYAISSVKIDCDEAAGRVVY